MAQKPNDLLKMTPSLHPENRQSFRHPPPRPPPPPPPLATASPSTNPKNFAPIHSTNSTSSSSSAFDQLPKRVTRDLANLSDCHGCRLRINHTDPSDRLQTLDSVWRIVLLCKKCIRSVNSGQTCPYCFNNTADSDCFKCSSCKRRVHKDCVIRYGNSAPWSYSSRGLEEEEEGVKSEFTVCIDCWVPTFFRKSIGFFKKHVLKTQNYTSSDVKSFEEITNFEAKRTVVLALEAQYKTLRKAVVAKNAVNNAKNKNNASELVASKKDKDKVLLKSSSISSDDTNETEVVNDAELAFQLHRAMNSSPRTSRTLCPTNSSYVDTPEMLESSNVSRKLLELGQTLSNDPGERLKVYSRTRLKGKVGQTSSETQPCVIVYSRTRLKGKAGRTISETLPCVMVYSRTRLKGKVGQTTSDGPPCVMVYSRTRLKEKVGQTSSEAPPRVTMKEHGSSVDSDCSKPELLTYKRSRLKRKMCEERVGLSDLIKAEHNLGDDCRDFCGLRVSQREGSQHNLHLQDSITLCPLSFDGDNTVGEICAKNTTQAESCIAQEDRCLLKYSKRKKCSEPVSDVHEDTFPHPTPDPGIPTNWSVESRTSSNV
ncbi:PREDICTED: uncharacterized protein LOC109242713 [Nicotiana attenuata]|uniref:Uncharacterized protein n=1 Tax=Nicotiana attenuata TaxID=49451 RepID=A0A314L362_NICAT|nr:PREDICTED: uncharacterized protein LOC109242713 [Nicotiana attenuata]OIT35942.1 hypothetical protein A4A49_15725 [Nicotiana attenuata]